MLRPIRRVPALLPAAVWLLTACDTPPEWRGTVRDSAGIAIIENTADPLLPAGGLPAIGAPSVVMESDGELLDAAFDEAGRVVVLAADPRRVHVLDADGRPLRTLPANASLGGGVVWVAAPGDTILLPDLAAHEVVRFTSNGVPAGSVPIEIEQGVPLAWRTASADRLVEHARWLPSPGLDTTAREYLRTRGPGGHIGDTLLAMPSLSAAVLGVEGLTTHTVYEPLHVFGLLPDGRLLTARTPAYRITVHAPDGRPQRIITLPIEPDSIDAEAQDRLRGWVRAHYESRHFTASAIMRVINGLRFPGRRTVIADVWGGPGGTIWVQRSAAVDELTAASRRFDPRQVGGRDWDVFDADGRYLGAVRFPEGLRVTAWRGQTVLGIIAASTGDRVVRLDVGSPPATADQPAAMVSAAAVSGAGPHSTGPW